MFFLFSRPLNVYLVVSLLLDARSMVSCSDAHKYIEKKKKSSTTRMTNVSQHHQTNVWSCFHCPKTNKKNVPFGGSRLFSVNTDKIKPLQFCSDNWLGLVKKREAAKEQMEDWVRSDESAEWVSVQKCGPSAPGAKRKCLDWDWTRMSFSKNCFGKMRNLIQRTEQRGIHEKSEDVIRKERQSTRTDLGSQES